MRLAIFCNDFWPTIGGVQTGAWGLARALNRSGHHTLVLTRQPPNTQAAEVVDGIDVRRFDWSLRPRLTFPVRAVRAGVQVLSTLRGWRPGVVFAHFVSVHALYALICARYLRVPLILSFRGDDAIRIAERNRINRIVYRRLVQAADVNLFCSAWLREQTTKARWFRGVGSPAGLLEDAVEVGHREFLSLGTESYVLAAGRLVWKKGFDILLHAWEVVHRDISAQLWIAGDGPEEGSLKGLVVRHGLEGSVRFLGPVPNARLLGLLERSALCIVPSREEPYGIIVVEAQALGVPVVAAAVGNIPCLLDHGVTGYLAGPSVEGLAQGLLAAWRDPQRPAVGAAGRTAPGATRGYHVMAAELVRWADSLRNHSYRRH
jgi:glycogen(starch) synthase